ncbi:GyrI-like domain-containing protein [Microbacterium esteraromaticum]|uniref:GyrI-like domain-containing protein n=1 Tax=Microbacterium esteraromaticum TaxID=57043 RepID=UPI001A8C861C|nr:GyrI-like domain-containing protein [Microbacterium esteraromaticum]
MTKSDFKKTLDRYRSAPGEFRVLEVPATRYLMIDGAGDPNSSPEYTAALEALYPLAYAVKFASARELGQDYVVPPLEGLWWADDMTAFTSARDKSRWHWTLMLMVPDWIPVDFVEAARERVAAKKEPSVRLDEVRLETLTEGLCVQTLHVGAFDDEGPLLARMHDEFVPGAGLRMTGRHHEIYLSDPRRTAPERLRTLLRQPVRAVSDTA